MGDISGSDSSSPCSRQEKAGKESVKLRDNVCEVIGEEMFDQQSDKGTRWKEDKSVTDKGRRGMKCKARGINIDERGRGWWGSVG